MTHFVDIEIAHLTYLILLEIFFSRGSYAKIGAPECHTHPVRIVYVLVVVQTITQLIYQSLKNDSESKQLV